MRENYLTLCGDVFGVEERIKEIDKNYRVFFNKIKNRYEVHNVSLKPNTLVLVSPYDELDARLIKLVRQSSVSRANEIFEEIEKHNEKILNSLTEEEIEKKTHEATRLAKMKSLMQERRG